jgi:hypothetical protein
MITAPTPTSRPTRASIAPRAARPRLAARAAASAAAAAMAPTKIHYFAIRGNEASPLPIARASASAMSPSNAHRRRSPPLTAPTGRAEPARLLLSAVGAEWENVVPDWGTMKSDAALYPFGQLPVMEDGGVLVSQSNAMLRHLGRKHALAGAGLAQQAAVDVLLDGAEAIKVRTASGASSAPSLIDQSSRGRK